MLDDAIIPVITKSFETLFIHQRHTRLARVFYDRLFEVDPTLQKQFTRSMKEQRHKFYMMLKHIVQQLDHPELLELEVRELGLRHRMYGVKREDYATFFGAFIYALSAALGNDFTAEVRHAWCEWCEYIGGLMCEEIQHEKDGRIAHIQQSLITKTNLNATD